MKNALKVIGLAGLLALVLTVRALAAPSMQVITVTPPAPQQVQGTPTTAIPQGQYPFVTATPSAQGMGMRGGMRGRMGMRGGMMGGATNNGAGTMQWQMNTSGAGGFSMTHEMMYGVSPMQNDVAMRLGMTTQDLYNHMASGKSLVQIATEKGITEQQLMDHIMAGRFAVYGQAVKEGHMTTAQANDMLQNLNNNLKMMVNGQGSGAAGWNMMWGTQPNPQTVP